MSQGPWASKQSSRAPESSQQSVTAVALGSPDQDSKRWMYITMPPHTRVPPIVLR